MPSRWGAPRGSLPRILAEAGDIADARIRLTMKLVDEFTDASSAKGVSPMGEGGRLSTKDFRALLGSNPEFREQVAKRWLFATPEERTKLLKEMQAVFPQGRVPGGGAGPQGGLPAAVTGDVPEAVPPEEQGTALGGAPQGAAPVGPMASPGAAPLPPGGPSGGVPPPVPPGGPPTAGPSGLPGAPPPGAMPGPPLPGAGMPMPGMPVPGMPPGVVMPGGPLPAGPMPPPGIPLTPTGGAIPRPSAAARLV